MGGSRAGQGILEADHWLIFLLVVNHTFHVKFRRTLLHCVPYHADYMIP